MTNPQTTTRLTAIIIVALLAALIGLLFVIRKTNLWGVQLLPIGIAIYEENARGDYINRYFLWSDYSDNPPIISYKYREIDRACQTWLYADANFEANYPNPCKDVEDVNWRWP